MNEQCICMILGSHKQISLKDGSAHSNMHITFNLLTLTSEMHFVKFHPEVVCLLTRGQRKYAPLGMRLLWTYIRSYFLVYICHLMSHFVITPKLQRIWSWSFGFAIWKIWAFIWYQTIYYFQLNPGGENVIGIRAFKTVWLLLVMAAESHVSSLLRVPLCIGMS